MAAPSEYPYSTLAVPYIHQTSSPVTPHYSSSHQTTFPTSPEPLGGNAFARLLVVSDPFTINPVELGVTVERDGSVTSNCRGWIEMSIIRRSVGKRVNVLPDLPKAVQNRPEDLEQDLQKHGWEFKSHLHDERSTLLMDLNFAQGNRSTKFAWSSVQAQRDGSKAAEMIADLRQGESLMIWARSWVR